MNIEYGATSLPRAPTLYPRSLLVTCSLQPKSTRVSFLSSQPLHPRAPRFFRVSPPLSTPVALGCTRVFATAWRRGSSSARQDAVVRPSTFQHCHDCLSSLGALRDFNNTPRVYRNRPDHRLLSPGMPYPLHGESLLPLPYVTRLPTETAHLPCAPRTPSGVCGNTRPRAYAHPATHRSADHCPTFAIPLPSLLLVDLRHLVD